MVKKILIIASSVVATAVVADEIVSKATNKKPLRKKIMDKVKEVYGEVKENPNTVENVAIAGGAGISLVGIACMIFGYVHKLLRKSGI